MEIMGFLYIIVHMSIMARAAGGGLFAKHVWSRLPEILFALPIALAASSFFESIPVFIVSFIFSYVAMEMGHGTFYTMKGYASRTEGRIQTIEKILRPIYSLTGKTIYTPFYSWFMMGIKGALIAAPLGIIPAVINMVLWPTAYWIGHRKLNRPEYAEWISGAFMGLILGIYILI